jgi:hypothetical protein
MYGRELLSGSQSRSPIKASAASVGAARAMQSAEPVHAMCSSIATAVFRILEADVRCIDLFAYGIRAIKHSIGLANAE